MPRSCQVYLSSLKAIVLLDAALLLALTLAGLDSSYILTLIMLSTCLQLLISQASNAAAAAAAFSFSSFPVLSIGSLLLGTQACALGLSSCFFLFSATPLGCTPRRNHHHCPCPTRLRGSRPHSRPHLHRARLHVLGPQHREDGRGDDSRSGLCHCRCHNGCDLRTTDSRDFSQVDRQAKSRREARLMC